MRSWYSPAHGRRAEGASAAGAGQCRMRAELPAAECIRAGRAGRVSGVENRRRTGPKTLVHERAHIALGHDAELRASGCRGRVEVEAESVAFMVCAEPGMDTKSYSLPYVARCSEGDTKVITQTAERVVSAARAISEAIEAREEPSYRAKSLGGARGSRLFWVRWPGHRGTRRESGRAGILPH